MDGGGGSGGESEAATKTQEAAVRGRDFVLQELIKTEKDYVRDLSYIVEGYLAIIDNPNPPVPKPESFSDTKKRLLFANIESIYKFHKEYVPVTHPLRIAFISM